MNSHAATTSTGTPSIGGAAGLLRFDDLFAVVNPIVIGRDRECTIHLPHPTVSIYHAILERQSDGGLLVSDLDSATGVYINGQRVRQPSLVYEGDRVGIGPYLFTRRGMALVTLDSSRSLRLEARGLCRDIPLAGGGTRRILDDVSLVVRPGEFVTLLGPSGSGKSTLMDCLNGRRRATAGRVLANGRDFYEDFDSFRQSLGYVPQKDIVHTQLTVRRALYYTARLRLPTDTSRDELERRIDSVVAQMELGPHQNTMVGNLSGGQIKRVSLGAELIARPPLLYIDEATSGLDAGTEARMMRLFRTLADEGKSIICITHALENVDQCHLLLVLAAGRLMYFGPSGEAADYFGVRSLSQVYDRLGEQTPAQWNEQYRQSRYHKAFVEDRLAEGDAMAAAMTDAGSMDARRRHADDTITVSLRDVPALSPLDVPPSSGAAAPAVRPGRALRARYRKVRRAMAPARRAAHQFRVITRRYVELIFRDPRSLRLLLLQAPVVALFLLVGFANKKYEDKLPKTRPINENEARVLAQANAWRMVLARDPAPASATRPAATQPAGDPTIPATQPVAGPNAETGPPVDSERRKQLEALKFNITAAGKQTTVNGWTLHQMVQEVHERRVTPERLAAMSNWDIKLENGNPPSTVSGVDLLTAAEEVSQSRVFDALVSAAEQQKPVVIEEMIIDPRFTFMLLNILAITVFWFGSNNAAKEIVKEQSVYARERAVNLGITPYLASKFVVMGVVSAVQAVGLAGAVLGTLWAFHVSLGHHYPPDIYKLGFGQLAVVLSVLSLVGVGVGLLISAFAVNPDRANALLPYVLIPQIILGGAIIPIKDEPISTLARTLSPVYWSFKASQRGSANLPTWHPLYAPQDFSVLWACTALGMQLAVVLLLCAVFLRMMDYKK